MRIHLGKSDITKREIEAALGVLETPQLAFGLKQKALEERITEYAGVERTV